MPIVNTIQGNVLSIMIKDLNYDFCVHGANCHGTMGSGIAGQFARNPIYANVIKADLEGNLIGLGEQVPVSDKRRLGDITVASIKQTVDGLADEFDVVNAYTQYDFGTDKVNVDYDAVRSCFTLINNKYGHDYTARCLIPMIGAGLAGGDWEVIKKIIDEVTPDLKITVVEYVAN